MAICTVFAYSQSKSRAKKNPWYPLASSYIGMKGNMNHQSGHFGQFCLFGLFLNLFRAPFRAARPRPGSIKSRHLFVIAIRSKSAISSWPLPSELRPAKGLFERCRDLFKLCQHRLRPQSATAQFEVATLYMCNDGGAAFDIPCLSSPM